MYRKFGEDRMKTVTVRERKRKVWRTDGPTDRRTDGRTDGQCDHYMPPYGGIKNSGKDNMVFTFCQLFNVRSTWWIIASYWIVQIKGKQDPPWNSIHFRLIQPWWQLELSFANKVCTRIPWSDSSCRVHFICYVRINLFSLYKDKNYVISFLYFNILAIKHSWDI